ncbi:MAG: 4-hydroxy-tetrahydrodipicolinate reductase [Dethiobacteria bacterium]|jgi:4-hydroxy-tetrahydrodipicolinate reductase|nr:4-hydroxy-tetrahydrodipicolinate reductase [Bacillota bacterium]
MEIKVAVSGACGNMGQEVCRTILDEEGMQLVAAIDLKNSGEDIGEILGGEKIGVHITSDLAVALQENTVDVLVDFTSPLSVFANIKTALKNRVRLVVGTTGLTEVELEQASEWVKEYETAAIIAPNFTLGAVLMTEFAAKAARFFPDVEIIELHHDQKIDAPSGTALKTAERISENHSCSKAGSKVQEVEKLTGARGGRKNGIRIHSVRLPGLVAHQEVIFGGIGQTLTIRHDSLSRKSFMPGVILAIRRVVELDNTLVYGLEKLLEL